MAGVLYKLPVIPEEAIIRMMKKSNMYLNHKYFDLESTSLQINSNFFRCTFSSFILAPW